MFEKIQLLVGINISIMSLDSELVVAVCIPIVGTHLLSLRLPTWEKLHEPPENDRGICVMCCVFFVRRSFFCRRTGSELLNRMEESANGRVHP